MLIIFEKDYNEYKCDKKPMIKKFLIIFLKIKFKKSNWNNF